MVFNALISNTDDHPRNHALIATRRGWTLSPAYDLTPTPSPSLDQRDLALVAGASGRWATRENLLSECPRFRLTREEANLRVDQIKHVITSRWRDLVKRFGATETECRAIAPAFDYPGFEYPVHPHP
jgi:serine/threonine-protein kinase HipA